eukprot:m.478081 g.478081  ORF g.478081 m.478081 type:complete len:300 (-) comp21028_c0_seq1:74-973(-)
MILLEFHNRILAEALRVRCEQAQGGEKIDAVDVTIADFDGVTYHVSNPDGDREKIQTSISLNFFADLQDHGVDKVIEREYGSMVVSPEPGYDVSLVLDLKTVGADYAAVVNKLAYLRRNCFAGVFEKFFEMQRNGEKSAKPAVVHYRPGESMYISSHKDRVTVVFSTKFQDDDDVIIGKVFMQEFKEGKKGNNAAPTVLFTHKDPPQELQGTAAETGDNIGYVTFVLFARHTDPKVSDRSIDLIHTFRDYLHYHIKCSKAYLHSRMRSRTSELLKVLNRARPDVAKTKKTASGRSFIRK